MAESIQVQVDRLGTRLKSLHARLAESGYVFQYPESVFPGPEPDAPLAIETIEREAGPIPLALKLFWLRVGSIDLCGAHPSWSGCEYPDPLVVFPPSVALAELDEYRQERQVEFLIPIAPDDFHKANVSGGMYYNVSVPAAADDPPLNEERHGVSFLKYLELALQSGGFPGLEKCSKHNWPIDQLRSEA